MKCSCKPEEVMFLDSSVLTGCKLLSQWLISAPRLDRRILA